MIKKLWLHLGVVFFNMVGTHIPSHHIRQAILRLWGAKIGKDTSIFMGSTVFAIEQLRIGECTSIGFRCLLDARGGLTIGNNVVVASDTHFIAGYHDYNTPDFAHVLQPIVVEDYVWIASRSTVAGATIGRGAVVGGCSLVLRDVAPLDVVAGVPAKVVNKRDEAALAYSPKYRPPFF